jgi:hypothetical protein
MWGGGGLEAAPGGMDVVLRAPVQGAMAVVAASVLPATVQSVMATAAVPPATVIGDGCSTPTKNTILPILVNYFDLINSIRC